MHGSSLFVIGVGVSIPAQAIMPLQGLLLVAVDATTEDSVAPTQQRTVATVGALTEDTNRTAQDDDTMTAAQIVARDGQMWFERMQQVLQAQNFSVSLVHIQGQRTELFRWLHGVSDDGQSLEILYSLNGPEVHIVRRNQRVSYFHPMMAPYSIRANSLFGPIPLGFYNSFAELADSYNVVAMGGARVIDRDQPCTCASCHAIKNDSAIRFGLTAKAGCYFGSQLYRRVARSSNKFTLPRWNCRTK